MMSQAEIEAMFQSLHEPEKTIIAPVKFQELKPIEKIQKQAKGISHLAEVDLEVEVELGATQMTVREVLDLDVEMVVELDCLAGEPVDINLNGVPFAKGEVVVINENFGARVTEFFYEKTEPETEG